MLQINVGLESVIGVPDIERLLSDEYLKIKRNNYRKKSAKSVIQFI